MTVLFEKYFFLFLWFFASITFFLSIGVENGYHYGPGFIFLSSVFLFLLRPKWSVLNKDDKALFWTFFFFSLSMFFYACIDVDGKLRDVDLPSKYLLTLPVLFLLLISGDKKEWLWYGIIGGNFLALPIAIYQKYVVGESRASGWENAIHFGNISILLAFLSLVSAIYFFSQNSKKMFILSLFASFIGIAVSILSGTRGGWVAIPLIAFFLYWESRALLTKKMRKIVFMLFSSFILICLFVPQVGVQNRMLKAVEDVKVYLNGDTDTSVGLRFEMWKASWYMFTQKPLLGVGASQSKKIREGLADEGYISKNAVNFSTAHNEYLEALSERGIVGLIFLLALYLVPMKLFLRKLRVYKNNWEIKSYALAGAIIPMCFMDFGLTMVMLSYSIGVTLFAFPIVYFWAAVRWAERDELSKSTSS